jgi:hypothetical protein
MTFIHLTGFGEVFYIWFVPTPLGGGKKFGESLIWKEEATWKMRTPSED